MVNSPYTVSKEVYDISKLNFYLSIGCKVIVYSIGVVSVFITNKYSAITPLLALLFIILSEVFLYVSDTYKSTAESLQRNLDYADSFGKPIDKKQIADILAGVPEFLQKRWKLKDIPYFSSKEIFGAKKAMENLEESASWSNHLANTMYYLYLIIAVSILILSFSSIYSAFYINIEPTASLNISKVALSTMMLVFSIGTFRFMIGYFRFHKKAKDIETRAINNIKSNTLTEIDSIRLWSEYQIARAAAPLIPTFIWKLRRDRLNELWDASHN